MNTTVKRILAVLLAVLMIAGAAFAAEANYEHDPRLCAAVMEDVVYNPDAVYGFSPNPDSTRLAAYVDADWSDAALVEGARKDRIAYHEQYEAMYALLEDMTQAGNTAEEIARAVSKMRNDIRTESYKDRPEDLARLKESNLATYGNEDGPTADSLFEKYGSWEMVTFKAFSGNPGMDACLGLYDDQYEHNVLTGAIEPSDTAVYTVKKGDYLAKIAQRYFGTGSKYKAIYRANKDKIKNINLIYEGDVLTIPLG